MVLLRSNRKLGSDYIWTFSLPSGNPEICVGMSELCRRVCYDRVIEARWPSVKKRYQKNYHLSLLPEFPELVLEDIDRESVVLGRVHIGGDLYSGEYAEKWYKIFRTRPGARWWFYTRSWRTKELRPVLKRIAGLRNVRQWWSADQETGMPRNVPRRVRVAWLQDRADHFPPAALAGRGGLVFRTKWVKEKPAARVNGVLVCPPENGLTQTKDITCWKCARCWKKLPEDREPGGRPGRLTLKLVEV